MKILNSIIFFILLSLSLKITAQDYWKAEDYYHNSSSQKDAAADLMAYVPFKGNETILDVGCGDGKITAGIAAKIPHGSIVGVDISTSMINFAQATFPTERYPNLTFLLKDAQKLDYQGRFDVIFSFTTLQWIQDHHAFLEGAYKGLKPEGTLAITMPLGLPSTLEQAVNEMITSPEWSSYFKQFSTGWNFVEEAQYKKMLKDHQFNSVRLAVVPQKDIFPSREAFEKFIGQWFPYLRPLPENLRKLFLSQVVNRFLTLESPFPNGEVHFKIRRLEVVAQKR